MWDNKSFKEKITSNIKDHSVHITMVSGGQHPRYAYTIGILETLGFELVLAGGISFLGNDVFAIINAYAKDLLSGKTSLEDLYNSEKHGSFVLREIDSSWNALMLLGVYDYYNTKSVKAFQIVPDEAWYTLDIPDMTRPFSELSNPIWKWLRADWDYTIPDDITVVTNLDTLKGKPLTEVMRWEEYEWEMFAGAVSELDKEKDLRVVPIGLMFGIDGSLANRLLDIEIGKGLWRESGEDEWQDW